VTSQYSTGPLNSECGWLFNRKNCYRFSIAIDKKSNFMFLGEQIFASALFIFLKFSFLTSPPGKSCIKQH